MITIINKGKCKNEGVRVKGVEPACWKWGEDRMGRVRTLFMGPFVLINPQVFPWPWDQIALLVHFCKFRREDFICKGVGVRVS